MEDHEPTADVDAEHGEQAAYATSSGDRPDQTGWRVHVPLTVALAVVVLLTGLAAWLGVRSYQAHQDQTDSNQSSRRHDKVR